MDTRRRSLPPALLLVALLAAMLAACGGGPAPSSARASDAPSAAPSAGPSATPVVREVAIEMTDLRFTPDQLEVTAGETIRFVVTNAGAIRHELFIGDEAGQAEHEREMLAGTAHSHGDMIAVEPGTTGTLDFRFDEPGPLLYGCHEAGHYAAGMFGRITVLP